MMHSRRDRRVAPWQDRSRDFSSFKVWLAANGPFEYILDGANIGFYGQVAQPTINTGLHGQVIRRALVRSSCHV